MALVAGCAHSQSSTSERCPSVAPPYVEAGSLQFGPSSVNADDVCLLGAGGDTGRTLLDLVARRRSKPIDAHAISNDIRSIMATGLVSDVRVVAIPLDGGRAAKLLYLVKENPRLVDVVVVGDPRAEAWRSSVEPYLYEASGKPFSSGTLARLMGNLKRGYLASGYFEAQVSSVVEAISSNEVRVKIRIDEGPRSLVARLQFEGARFIAENELRKDLSTVEGGPYSDETLEHDQDLILSKYWDRGRIDAVVRAVPILMQESRSVMVAFEVQEGAFYVWGDVKAVGLDLPALGDLAKRKGEIFSRLVLLDDLELLNAAARARGKMVKAGWVFDAHPDSGRLDVTYIAEDVP